MTVESAQEAPEQRFVYRPAPLGARITVVVREDKLAVEGSWSLDLADICSLAFFEGRVGDSQMVRLDLQGSETLRSLSMNSGRAGSLVSDDALQFYAALKSALQVVSKVRPDLQVVLGSSGKVHRIMFVLGIVAVSLGAGLLTAAFLTNTPASKLAAAAVPFSMLILFGGALIRGYWPWRERVKVSPQDLVSTLNKALPDLQA